MRLIWLYICRNDEHNKGFFSSTEIARDNKKAGLRTG
ncbi:hypothetical protein ATCR1_21874 [Agrobacterium tumefaciens CCNWGS0286]|nr:hypothetical protein ATCR1_21874 [Agrobacterium tumefaciens CCNWGS0286]